MQTIMTVAKMSNDLKNAGAPEWTYNLGSILSATLVAGIILWLGIKAIKKVLAWDKSSKTTNAPELKKEQTKDQNSKMSTPTIIGIILGGTTTIAFSVGVAMPPDSIVQKVCVGICALNLLLAISLWLIAKVKTWALYDKWKAERKQEIEQTSKKKKAKQNKQKTN